MEGNVELINGALPERLPIWTLSYPEDLDLACDVSWRSSRGFIESFPRTSRAGVGGRVNLLLPQACL